MAGCAGSNVSINTANYDAPDVPSWVYVEAKRIVKMPKGDLQVKAVKELIVKLRRSELRKNDTIKTLIANQETIIRHLRKRGTKP
jgi:hypothetical protein